MFSVAEIYVGLDYHVDSIRVCVMDSEGHELMNRSCANDAGEVADWIDRWGQPKVVALEACCGASDFAEELHHRTGWRVKLANAGAVQAMKRGPDKTDPGDAFWLADLARVNHLPEVWLPDATTRQLRRLVRYRQQLAKQRRETKQQVRGLLNDERVRPPANAWTRDWRAWVLETKQLSEQGQWVVQQQLRQLDHLEGEIRLVEARLGEATAGDRLTQQLCEHKGVGLVTAATLRAELGSFRRFRNGKQLARYCGVTPCNRSSGRIRADAGLVKRASQALRQMVIELAHRLARWDPRWRALKQALVKRGKARSVATAAVANRWLRWVYHQILEQEHHVAA